MPNRFRPTVLPDYTPRTNPGETIGRAIEGYSDHKFREEENERRDRQEERLQREANRRNTIQDIEMQEWLRDRGLEEVEPRAVQESRARGEEAVDRFAPRDVMETRTAGRDETLERGRFGPSRPELDPEDIRGAFRRRGEMGESANEPVLLPGQYRPGTGFAKKPVFFDDIPRPDVEESLSRPPTFRAGNREFARTGPTAEERQFEEAQAAFSDRVEALVAAGVPEDRAAFAAQDEVLARQYLGPEEQEEAQITAEQLQAIGYDENMAMMGARDQTLARQLVGEVLQRSRPRSSSGSGGSRYSAEDLVGLGIDPALAELGARDEVLARQLVNDARRPPEAADLPDDVRERRREIAGELDSLTQPWQQQIADRLAGIGPNGELIQPMTAEQILAGFEANNISEEDLNQVQRFLRPFLRRR